MKDASWSWQWDALVFFVPKGKALLKGTLSIDLVK